MKDIPLSNDRVERRIFDMAEDTETQFTDKKLKNRNICITTGRIYRYSEQQHFTHVCTIYWQWWKWYEEDILSVSELPTHTTCSGVFKVLNGFIEERSLEWKNCVGVCTDGAACLTGRNSCLVTKIKDMAGNNWLSTHCCTIRQNLVSKKERQMSLMKSYFNLLKLLII